MSFEAELDARLRAALAADAEIAGAAHGVFLERPVRAAPPYLTIGPLIATDWSAKGARGREVRTIVTVHDAGESWTRTVALQGAVSRAVEALPRTMGGWRLGAVLLLRSRTARDGTNGWLGTVEHRVRAMEAN